MRNRLLLLILAATAALAVAAPAVLAATRAIDAPATARLTLEGPTASGTGAAVAQLGDVNGDGRPDVAIGAPYRGLPGRPSAGTVFVVFGSAATGAHALEALTRGFQIIGGRAYRAGMGVAAAGDVDGDGRPDILLSAPRKNGYKVSGSAFVVFGKADTATVDLGALTPAQGFEIVGIVPSPGATPDSIAGAGDVDHDGYADVIVTESSYRKRGLDYRGGVAVVYGSRSPRRVDLQRLGSRGFRIAAPGIPTVAAAGDVNGDVRADLLVGVAAHFKLPGARFPVNSAFVVFGARRTGTLDLRRLGGRGFRIGGLVRQRIYSPAVAGVGDINGDRRADLLVGRNPGGTSADTPEAVVVFGSHSTRTIDAGRLGSRGFRIVGPREGILVHVASAGDVNGDRVPDLGLGIWVPAGGFYDTSAYLIHGRRATTTLRLSDLGSAGVRLTGPRSTYMCGALGIGAALAPAGDFDGDGRVDLLLGAPLLGNCAGQALIVPTP